MEVDDFAQFAVIDSLARTYIPGFCKEFKVQSYERMKLLLKVHYLIHHAGECWTKDIELMMSTRKKKNRAKDAHMILYFLNGDNFVNKVEKDKLLGDRFVVTYKGRDIINSYITYVRRLEKEYFYKRREVHKERRERKEKENDI